MKLHQHTWHAFDGDEFLELFISYIRFISNESWQSCTNCRGRKEWSWCFRHFPLSEQKKAYSPSGCWHTFVNFPLIKPIIWIVCWCRPTRALTKTYTIPLCVIPCSLGWSFITLESNNFSSDWSNDLLVVEASPTWAIYSLKFTRLNLMWCIVSIKCPDYYYLITLYL